MCKDEMISKQKLAEYLLKKIRELEKKEVYNPSEQLFKSGKLDGIKEVYKDYFLSKGDKDGRIN